MNRVLIVVGEYIKRTAQNGLCIYDIKNQLEADGIKVDILCVESTKIIPEDLQMNINVIQTKEYVGRLSDFFRKTAKFISMPIGSYRLTWKIVRKLKELISNNSEYDAVIAVVNPTESAEAVYQYKKRYNPAFKFILYEIDPASNRYKIASNLFQTIWRYRSTQWEKKIYASADKIIHMKTHACHFSKDIYDSFREKVHYLDIPSFKITNASLKCNLSINTVSFIYAGAFYPILRDPDYMIRTLLLLSSKRNILVNIFTGRKLINDIKILIINNENFTLYRLIPQIELNEYINRTDILLSVGNYNSDFLPSKILYYIGTMKPIIHFHSDEYDVALNYLNHYPLALLIDQRENIDTNVKAILAFLDNLKNIDISQDFLLEKFMKNTPEYTARKIMELIYEY